MKWGKRLIQNFAEFKNKPLTAYKYIRSISETALLYRPIQTRNLQT